VIDLTIKITKQNKSVELTLSELQDLHAQIEALSSVAVADKEVDW
jgi:hypothetical protein